MRDHICPMKITVNGRPTHMQAMEPAEEIVIKNRTQIAPKVIAYLETHDYREPLLLALPVGSGKTYTTIHHVVPWAVERKLQVLFISSRSAINLQVKEELLNVVGLTNLRRQLTDEGLSKQEEFGPVTVRNGFLADFAPFVVQSVRGTGNLLIRSCLIDYTHEDISVYDRLHGPDQKLRGKGHSGVLLKAVRADGDYPAREMVRHQQVLRPSRTGHVPAQPSPLRAVPRDTVLQILCG